MVQIGYTMMTERAGPRDLVEHLLRAERVGFDFAVISDHYFPWLPAQGQPRVGQVPVCYDLDREAAVTRAYEGPAGNRTVGRKDPPMDHAASLGIDPTALEESVLLHELEQIHRTRHETLLHGSADALDRHSLRMAELEAEYLRRHPQRHVASGRTRLGARARTHAEATDPAAPRGSA
jgi:hypothetical protein